MAWPSIETTSAILTETLTIVNVRSVLKEFGDRLRRAREGRCLSLQATAEPADITAPYLLKLERGQVTTPSPHVLGRLGLVLGVPYLELMELAGYLDEEQLTVARGRKPRPHPLAGEDLSPEEWFEVAAFIRELKKRRRITRQGTEEQQRRRKP